MTRTSKAEVLATAPDMLGRYVGQLLINRGFLTRLKMGRTGYRQSQPVWEDAILNESRAPLEVVIRIMRDVSRRRRLEWRVMTRAQGNPDYLVADSHGYHRVPTLVVVENVTPQRLYGGGHGPIDAPGAPYGIGGIFGPSVDEPDEFVIREPSDSETEAWENSRLESTWRINPEWTGVEQ